MAEQMKEPRFQVVRVRSRRIREEFPSVSPIGVLQCDKPLLLVGGRQETNHAGECFIYGDIDMFLLGAHREVHQLLAAD